MGPDEFERILKNGESTVVEFKRCGATPGTDTFETICSFANRNGGNIFLGVTDSGEVTGILENSVLSIKRNITSMVNNPKVFDSAPAIEFEDIAYRGKTVIRIWVPAIQGVYRFKGEVFDRVADSDVRLRSDAQITSLYLRKYNIYTEQHIFPHLSFDDLRIDLIERAREMAIRNRPGHPWGSMNDRELLRSAQLWGKDIETGTEGFNRACALLFGSDSIVAAACPAYKTDAVVRLRDIDRYDDRIVVRTNLIEAYDLLTEFCAKHLPDPFYLEGGVRKSVRDLVVRELVSNMLIHREYTSPFPAKIIIDRAGIRTENASRALFDGRLTLSDFNPIPKNPIIAGVFAQIGLAEELGSGMRNLTKYARPFMGADAVLEEGDVFRATIPRAQTEEHGPTASKIGVPKQQTLDVIVALAKRTRNVTVEQAATAAGVSRKTAAKYLRALAEHGLVVAHGQQRVRAYTWEGNSDTSQYSPE